jgi:hypothetical protein
LASPTDVAQISTFEENLDNEDDDSDLARTPTLTREDSESEIWDMLAQETAQSLVNEMARPLFALQ